MIVRYDPDFFRQLKKLNVKIRNHFKQAIFLFSKNPNDSALNNHKLHREWEGSRSIDINADWRAIYKEVTSANETIAYFVAIGTHSQLYK